MNENTSTRGSNCTSVDAFIYAVHRGDEKRWLIPIEWKYTENYSNEDKSNEDRPNEDKGPNGCFIVDQESESSEYNVYGENEYRPLYHGDYEDCLKWIQKNGNDYRGQMRSWGKNVDPKRSVAVNKQWK